MNLLVGDDDVTADKDFRQVFKRIRDLLLRRRGVTIWGQLISPTIIRQHLRDSGHSSMHITSLFKPDDKQDVQLSYMLVSDLWGLDAVTGENAKKPGYAAARNALQILGLLCKYLLYPYICVDLSLQEQLQYLSAAAHLTLVLFRHAKSKFFPKLLFGDIMIMIKNVFFCTAKAKVDTPTGKFWIILLGTDRLEALFGIIRTMVGNDANADLLQLVARITGTTEVANILAQYPQWDRSPRRIRLPSLNRDGSKAELPDNADHINPGSWRGDVLVRKMGRNLLENEPLLRTKVTPALRLLGSDNSNSNTKIDILRPFGSLVISRGPEGDALESTAVDEVEEDDDDESDGEDAAALAQESEEHLVHAAPQNQRV
jgi:hypothetical protein